MSFLPVTVIETPSRLILFLYFLTILYHTAYSKPPSYHEGLRDNPCKACMRLAWGFKEAYEKTEKSSYGGGNTDWEEKKLKGYAKSETRLAEIVEATCSHKDPDCSNILEKYEEPIEEWYQKSSLEIIETFDEWLCVNTSNLCCPSGTFGKNCRRCHRGGNGLVCSGHGKCDGDGMKVGTGRCECDDTYVGTDCSDCRNGYAKSVDDQKNVTCTDIDECQTGLFTLPCGLQKCNNTNGGFECYGEPFYRDTSKLTTLVIIGVTATFLLFNNKHGLLSLVCTTGCILIILYAKNIL